MARLMEEEKQRSRRGRLKRRAKPGTRRHGLAQWVILGSR